MTQMTQRIFFEPGEYAWRPFGERVNPPRWARSGHAQTILGYFTRKKTALLPRGRRVRVELPDGDMLDGHLLEAAQPRGTVHLFHGLSGTNQSTYMLAVGRKLRADGWNALLMNHRGCGKGIELPCRKPYHSGSGDDVSAVIAWARQHLPGPQVAIGFSLGGSALLNLVTEKRGSAQPDLAISVNAPLDVRDCAYNLENGFNKIYSRTFKRDCYRNLQGKLRAGWITELAPERKMRTIVDLDVLHTAPMTGHKTVDEFYDFCSAGPFLERVRVPTVLLTAGDDPIAVARHYRAFARSPKVMLHIESQGGHLGYLTVSEGRLDHGWLERAIAHYLEQAPELLRSFSSRLQEPASV